MLQHAFTGDGTTIVATFSHPPAASSVQAADFTLTSSTGSVTQTITAVAVSGASATLTLSGALPKGPTYTLAATEVTSEAGEAIGGEPVPLSGTLYLAMVWHQHQPVYIDPSGAWEWSRGPWVRKHATKDYYDMVAMLADHPDIHVQVNLTPVLLMQLQSYYVDRLAPYVNTTANTVDKTGYFGQRGAATEPVTDPWIDMLLSPTPAPGDLTEQQKEWFYRNVWSNFSISEVMIARFPEYLALKTKKTDAPQTLTQDDLRAMKIWFQLAWFDPRFLRGPVTLPDGQVVDLSDLVTEQADGTFTRDVAFTEAIGERLVVEEYKVLKNVVRAHKELQYDATLKTGQVEVMTTPYYHPILPLITDTELTKQAMPTTQMPSQRFQQPQDANVHVAKAVKLYTDSFGKSPTGMWPAEGSVAEAVVPTFRSHGVRWIATDRRVLEKSTPANQPLFTPYRIDSDTVVGDGGDVNDELAIVFRDTAISDKIGFHYQGGTPPDNVADFMTDLRKYAPAYGTDGLLTIILDGENAWEWYQKDNDAIGFLNGMYQALTAAQQTGEMRTVTVSEYLDGNPARNVPAHPVHDLPELEPLFAGSWISGSFSTWIGEDEENLGWDYLAQVRADLAAFEAQGLTRPDPSAAPPAVGTTEWYRYKAWESMYAAEGSDWFWWFGSDQTAAGGDDSPFDKIYRALLKGVYKHAISAGINTTIPDFPKIVRVCDPPTKTPLTAAPTINGAFSPDDGKDPKVPSEWTAVGAGVCEDIDSGDSPDPDDVIAIRYHGVTADSLYVALRMNENVAARLGTNFQVRAYFSQKHIITPSPVDTTEDPKLATTRVGTPITFIGGGAARELSLDFSGSQVAPLMATTDGSTWGTPAAAGTVVAAVANDVIEVKIPLAALNYQGEKLADDPLEMLITVVAGGTELDRTPNINGTIVFYDRTRLVELTWILDATGTRIPLSKYITIANPPPPNGTGKAYIVGNQPALGQWTPNSIQMYDDGTNGDATAGDNQWTFRTLLPPQTEVQYKYTIGAAGQSWGGTEEYPMTNRGFVIRDGNDNLKMILKDVFADRPDPSGTLPPLTEVVDP